LLRPGTHKWGRFDFDHDLLEIHDEPQPRDEDLLNLVAIQTALNRGKVYTLAPEEIPDRQGIAAIYRY
jgi:hypothetical protein